MVKFRGEDYFDERQVIGVLLTENDQLKEQIAEQERILNAFKEAAIFIKGALKDAAL